MDNCVASIVQQGAQAADPLQLAVVALAGAGLVAFFIAVRAADRRWHRRMKDLCRSDPARAFAEFMSDVPR